MCVCVRENVCVCERERERERERASGDEREEERAISSAGARAGEHGTWQQDQLLFGQAREVFDGHEAPGGDVEHRPLARRAEELLALQHPDFGRGGRERPPGGLVADTELVSQVALDPSLDVARTKGQAVQRR